MGSLINKAEAFQVKIEMFNRRPSVEVAGKTNWLRVAPFSLFHQLGAALIEQLLDLGDVKIGLREKLPIVPRTEGSPEDGAEIRRIGCCFPAMSVVIAILFSLISLVG